MTALAQQIIIDKLADEMLLDMRWNDFAKSTLRQERLFKPVLRDLFEEQKQRVLLNIQRNPLPETEQRSVKQTPNQLIMPWLLDPQEWHLVFENAARPFIRQAMSEGFDDGLDSIEGQLDVDLGLFFDVYDPNVAQAMTDKLQKFSFEVNNTTNQQLKKSLVAALENGETMRMVNQRVADVFKFAKGYRTNRIARTEIIGSYNSGHYTSMTESGVVKSRRWVATRDTMTRESHSSIDGEIQPLGKKYSNGLMFPGDWNGPLSEVIQCRCREIVEEFTDA